MRTAGWLLRMAALAAALVAVSGVPASAEVARDADFRASVERSVARGADWLMEALREGRVRSNAADPFPAGLSALLYSTLRAAGVARESETARSLYEQLREEYAAARDAKLLRTYSVAATLLAVERHAAPAGKEDSEARQDARADARWARDAVALLKSWQHQDGSWWYGDHDSGPPGSDPKRPAAGLVRRGHDLGNTHFAVLGLAAAARAGAKVPRSCFQRALTFLIAAQEDDGPEVPRPGVSGGPAERARGWSYIPIAVGDESPAPAYGSMTAGCIAAIVRCREELIGTAGYGEDQDRAAERAIRDGLAWLDRHWHSGRNPLPSPAADAPRIEGAEGLGKPEFWFYFHLSSVERAATLCGVDWIGEHDWYGQCAVPLLASQDTGGSWHGDVLDSCFALQFLLRATVPARQGGLPPAVGDGAEVDFSLAAHLEDADFEGFVDLVLTHWRKFPDPARRAALARRFAGVGTRVIPPLLRRLDADRLDIRTPTHGLLQSVTGRDFDYDPADERGKREGPLLAWHAWWIAHAENLAFDEDTGRLL